MASNRKRPWEEHENTLPSIAGFTPPSSAYPVDDPIQLPSISLPNSRRSSQWQENSSRIEERSPLERTSYSWAERSPKRARLYYDSPQEGNMTIMRRGSDTLTQERRSYQEGYQHSRQSAVSPKSTDVNFDSSPYGRDYTCHRCEGLEELIKDLIKGLHTLDSDLRQDAETRTGVIYGLQGVSQSAPDVSKDGIKSAFQWAVITVKRDTRIVHNLFNASPARSFPDSKQFPLEKSSSFSLGFSDGPVPQGVSVRRASEPASQQDQELVIEAMKKRIDALESDRDRLNSPRRASSFTSQPLTTVTQPPMPAPPPPFLHNSATLSPTTQQHLSDLQHQVSTKTLAYTTLKSEHESLLQALHRSQTRCSALERKHSVSDTEINSLSEERVTLLARVEELEKQVEDMIKQREDLRKEIRESGNQYMKILSSASTMEKKGSDERKAWAKEKADLQRSIQLLERGIDISSSGSPASGITRDQLLGGGVGVTSIPLGSDEGIEMDGDGIKREGTISHSPNCLHHNRELHRLRSRVFDLENILADMRCDGMKLSSKIKEMLEFSTGIFSRVDGSDTPPATVTPSINALVDLTPPPPPPPPTTLHPTQAAIANTIPRSHPHQLPPALSAKSQA